MPRVSELFYTRRSRISRNSDPSDVGSDYSGYSRLSDRQNRLQRRPRGSNAGRDRIHPTSHDPPRRVPLHSGQPPQLRSSQYQPRERESSRPENNGTRIPSGDATQFENQNNAWDRARFSGEDRLPEPVILARERLLQRLGAVTLSSGRQSDRSSSSTLHNDLLTGDELRLVEAVDWETEVSREWTTTRDSSNELNQEIRTRPPGLTQDVLNCLRVETYFMPEEGDSKGSTSTASRECSICLERFVEGDELMWLPCGHRYHVCCLDPWVRSYGDCPYCRQGIVLSMKGTSESPQVEPVEGRS